MEQISINFSRSFLILIFLINSSIALTAQTPGDICENNDCSPGIFSIVLDQPVLNAPLTTADKKRTDQFIHAYQAIKQLKATESQKPGWNASYRLNELTGQNCLRLYELEGFLAHEYEMNPGYKQFIDGQESDITAFKEDGFQNSRKSFNLITRMENHCPEELKALEQKKGPSIKDMPSIYQKLGQVLGYFDKDGNLLKPLKIPVADDTADLSKKKQVEALKEKVNALPVGADKLATLNNLTGDLTNAKSKLGILNTGLGGMKPRFGSLLPKLGGLLSKLGNLNGLLSGLKNFVPNIPNPNLLSKIGNLFNRGKDLAKNGTYISDKSNKLKDAFDNLNNKSEKVKKDLDKQLSNIQTLKDILTGLQGKKKALEERLENKPKKFLDELKNVFNSLDKEAKDFTDKAAKENEIKDKILDTIGKLTKGKDDILDQLKDLENKAEDLLKQKDELEKESKEAETEVDKVKKAEEAIAKAKDQLDELKGEDKWETEIADCEKELLNFFNGIKPLEELKDKLNGKLNQLLPSTSGLLTKIDEFKLFQNQAKSGKKGKALEKVNNFLKKANVLGEALNVLSNGNINLQTKIGGISDKINGLKNKFTDGEKLLDSVKEELEQLLKNKSGLKDKLDGKEMDIKQMEQSIEELLSQFQLFGDKSKCAETDKLEEESTEVKEELEEVEKELEESNQELEEISKEHEVLKDENEKDQELVEEAENIKKEFGKEMTLEPVTVEEWSESFEVKRQYWDAVFHPDEEVVEGFKGRYFEVRLKDAEKNVKLLFGPGEYYMDKSKFRNNYGSTIGAFVTEALHSLKKGDSEKMILFIQGSADIVGQKTFRGNLDEQYMYSEFNVLPMKSGQDSFAGTPVSKQIPQRNFTNTDLPNLRGNFLKEMVSVYSKKLKPVLLEGAVKEVASEGERNAIIYLFIPEEITTVGE